MSRPLLPVSSPPKSPARTHAFWPCWRAFACRFGQSRNSRYADGDVLSEHHGGQRGPGASRTQAGTEACHLGIDAVGGGSHLCHLLARLINPIPHTIGTGQLEPEPGRPWFERRILFAHLSQRSAVAH